MSTLTTALAANGIEAVEVESVKNGVVCKGYQIENGTNVKPVIYYSSEETVESFVRRAREIVAKKIPDFDATSLISRNRLLNHTYLCVQKQGEEAIVKKQYLDLELYVRLEADLSDDERKGTIKVTPEIINRAEISEEELFASAKTTSIKKSNIYTMAEIFGKIGAPDGLVDEAPFYVATYDDNAHGAGILALNEVLHEFCKEKGHSRLYILPSSTEEILLLPGGRSDPEDLAAMVNNVNTGIVDPVLQLNPVVYLYDDSIQRVSIASSFREEA